MTTGTLAPADMIRRGIHNKWWADKNQLMLVRNGICAKANNRQFDEFVHICQYHGLDPLLKQIYCFIFDHGTADEKMVAVVAIGGYRAIAERTKTYMPSDKEPRIKVDKTLADAKKPRPKNPKGLVSATVWAKKCDATNNWHSFSARAVWSEYAPLRPLKFQDDMNGAFVAYDDVYLDPKTTWYRRPEFMLEKCAEALVLRRGWPEDFANLYAYEEVDGRAANAQFSKTVDLTPSEYARVAQKELADRIDGVKAGIVVAWEAGDAMVTVPVSEFDTRVMEFIEKHRDNPQKIVEMHARNTIAFREYFQHDKGKFVALKREINAIQEKLTGKKNYFVDKAPDRRPVGRVDVPPAPAVEAAQQPARRRAAASRITSGRQLHEAVQDDDGSWPPRHG